MHVVKIIESSSGSAGHPRNVAYKWTRERNKNQLENRYMVVLSLPNHETSSEKNEQELAIYRPNKCSKGYKVILIASSKQDKLLRESRSQGSLLKR